MSATPCPLVHSSCLRTPSMGGLQRLATLAHPEPRVVEGGTLRGHLPLLEEVTLGKLWVLLGRHLRTLRASCGARPRFPLPLPLLCSGCGSQQPLPQRRTKPFSPAPQAIPVWGPACFRHGSHTFPRGRIHRLQGESPRTGRSRLGVIGWGSCQLLVLVLINTSSTVSPAKFDVTSVS